MDTFGYEIGEAIGGAGGYVVCRARRRRDGRHVLVEMSADGRREGDQPLEREFALLRKLTIPGAPAPVELLRTARGVCLLFEDRGLTPLRRRLDAASIPVESTLQIACSLCEILSEVHRRDLVHGNLTPATIWVDHSGTSVELFGFVHASGSRGTIGGLPAGRDLSYLSPEQTGRINRTPDSRSDLYSLGIILYELLTGAPPFASGDPLELIHAQIARTPADASSRNPNVPAQLSRILAKLLAKPADERYQSATGLAHDLARCLRDLGESGRIAGFELATHDRSDRFVVPQKLYGREREIDQLSTLFQRTCEGETGLLLVSGAPGVGKTSLIQELHGPIARHRGYFIAGKFDQIVRNIPYGALIQAFRGLMRQLLAESEERLSTWRSRLTLALGGNAGVLSEVIPEIELVMGHQDPPAPLGAMESQHRFQYAFQRFVAAVAAPDRPLVLFLDDLQWVDAATLDLLHTLMTGRDIRHLLVIGAYRESEVDATHLLTWALDRLHGTGAHVHRLTLGSLTRDDLTRLLADLLHGDFRRVDPLATLLHRKTDGNPFFVIQFLKTLQQDGLFTFDDSSGQWDFDLPAIAAAQTTDNVVDLMTRKLRQLSIRGQRALTLAACIGNPFTRATYLTVSGGAPEDADAGLTEALDAGLVLATAGSTASPAGPEEQSFAFLHDRVQHTAYALIPDERRASLHLHIGRLLLAQYPGGHVPDDRLFEIANHLNIGRALIADPEERLSLARLNLAAGRRAKASAAYRAAAGYLAAGAELLPDAFWPTHHALKLELHLEIAECQYLNAEFDAAEASLRALLLRADTRLELAHVHGLRIVLRENQSRYADAVQTGREALALFGIGFPDENAARERAIDAEVHAIDQLRAARPIAALIDLPVAADADVRMVLRLLTALWAPSYLSGNQTLTRLISATMVRLSLAHGNTEDSAYGYVTHAITIGPVRGDYAAAYEWGELALAVNARFDDAKRRAKIYQQFHAHVQLWRRSFESCIPNARQACRSGLETGDFTYAGYGAFTEAWPALLCNRDLEQFVRDYTPSVALLEQIQMPGLAVGLEVILSWALALQGRTSDERSLSHGRFDEQAFVAAHGDNPFLMNFYLAAHLHLCLVFQRFDAGLEYASRAQAAPQSGTIWPSMVDYWSALVRAGACTGADAAYRAELLARLDETERSLNVLAENCPENFRCNWLLVRTERARLAGHNAEAHSACDAAIEYARETRNIQQEALGHEIAARLRRLDGRDDLAAEAIDDARRAYAQWGAAAKARQLEPPVRADATDRPVVRPGPLPATGLQAEAVDLETVLRVARAIAGEIELEDLLRRLMQLALENAGARRGAFIGEHESGLFVEVEAEADAGVTTRRRIRRLDEADTVSHAVIRYVRRTGEDLVVGDATADERFAGDGYVQRSRTRSILCIPASHQGRLSGILYLENSLAPDAFTPARIEIMRILAAQAAISLENARLYEEMRSEVQRRSRAEEALRAAVSELEAMKNRLEAENVYLQEEIRTQHNFNEIVGNSPQLLAALRRVERVAPTESIVLILGETGTGKELFARAIHSRSARRDRPLVKVNCGAIAPGLVESELFGHVKGAFTGAIDKRVGRFELAHGGTIFLDEVGELPLDAQVKLLRVLQEQEFEPVGSSRTVRVNVRVIAATNRDLAGAVKEGTFRADLLYRLNVFPIDVPPLRGRTGDIPLLVGFFVTGVARRLGKTIQGFSARSMDRILRYPWPGNVRELQNVVERAAILAQGPVLDVEGELMPAAEPVVSAEPASGSLDDVQRAHIVHVLKSTGGVVEGAKGAATVLGLHPNTLRSRMKKLGITK